MIIDKSIIFSKKTPKGKSASSFFEFDNPFQGQEKKGKPLLEIKRKNGQPNIVLNVKSSQLISGLRQKTVNQNQVTTVTTMTRNGYHPDPHWLPRYTVPVTTTTHTGNHFHLYW